MSSRNPFVLAGVGPVVAAAALCAATFGALAQEAPAPAPAAPAAPSAQAAPAAPGAPSPWIKVCNTNPETKVELCVVNQELRSETGQPIAALTTSNLLRPGLAGLVKSLVPEIAPVRINGIAPGRVATDRIATLDAGRATNAGITVEEVQQQTIARIPLGRYGDPAEVGRVGAFLLSPATSYVTGSIVAVDGGMVRSLP